MQANAAVIYLTVLAAVLWPSNLVFAQAGTAPNYADKAGAFGVGSSGLGPGTNPGSQGAGGQLGSDGGPSGPGNSGLGPGTNPGSTGSGGGLGSGGGSSGQGDANQQTTPNQGGGTTQTTQGRPTSQGEIAPNQGGDQSTSGPTGGDGQNTPTTQGNPSDQGQNTPTQGGGTTTTAQNGSGEGGGSGGACYALVDAPPFEGSIVPYKSGTVMTPEENRRLAEEQRKNWDQIMEEIDQAIEKDKIRQQQLSEQAAPQNNAADQRVKDFADSHPIEGFRGGNTATSINSDTGEYDSIELQYVGPDGNVHYTAQFDGNGNPLGGVEQTPWGKASQNAKAHSPPGTTQAWEFDRDFEGNSYPSDVTIVDDNGVTRGTMSFNQDGQAYRGEFFDENGVRNGAFLDPSMEPTYDDPAGYLNEVSYEKIATGACKECEEAEKARNDIANEINQVAREMNDIAQKHRKMNDYARDHDMWNQAQSSMRGRFEHLAGERTNLQSQLQQAQQALDQCCEEKCKKDDEDDDKIKVGDDFVTTPQGGIRIGQDSNTWCRHTPATPATVPFNFGPTAMAPPNGPSTAAPQGGSPLSVPAGPGYATGPKIHMPTPSLSDASKYPQGNYTVPQSQPLDWGALTSTVPATTTACPQGNCGNGLFWGPIVTGITPPRGPVSGNEVVQITGTGFNDCYGSSCPQESSDPSQKTPQRPSYFSETTGIKIDFSVVLDSAGSQQAIEGESLKITGLDFSLPPDCTTGCDESKKTDVAAGQGPTQCVTGLDGKCTINISPTEFGTGQKPYYLNAFNEPNFNQNRTQPTPQTGLQDYSMPVNLVSTPTASSIGAVSGIQSGCSLGSYLCGAVTDQFAVGDFTHYVFAYPATQEQAFLNALGLNPGIFFFEINFCDEKKLPKPPQYSGSPPAQTPLANTVEPIGYAKINFTPNDLGSGN
jgi:hypothetical protein